MQIFSKNVHMMTRGSAALFAIYISLFSTESLIRLGGIVMFGFDAYTFYKTVTYVKPLSTI